MDKDQQLHKVPEVDEGQDQDQEQDRTPTGSKAEGGTASNNSSKLSSKSKTPASKPKPAAAPKKTMKAAAESIAKKTGVVGAMKEEAETKASQQPMTRS